MHVFKVGKILVTLYGEVTPERISAEQKIAERRDDQLK